METVEKVFEECLKIIKDREPKYGPQWKEEPLDELWGNVCRKFKGLDYQKKLGNIDMEFPIDLINYVAFYYLRLKDENE